MLEAFNGVIPDKKSYHDPSLKNNYGETVAMLLASKGL